MSEKTTDTKVSEEGRRGGVPGARAEISLQSMEKTMVVQIVPCSLWKIKVGQT